MYEIALIDVGRDNDSETFLSTSENIEGQIIANAKKYLMSDNVWIEESDKSTEALGVFNINAGFHNVGKATISKII